METIASTGFASASFDWGTCEFSTRKRYMTASTQSFWAQGEDALPTGEVRR